MEPTPIISLTPGLEGAKKRAQYLANRSQTTYAIWEHVGLYGTSSGDIPANHHFLIRASGPGQSDPPETYALVGLCKPGEEE